jgi:hypothetical protein
VDHGQERLVLDVELEDGPHPDRLVLVDDQAGAATVDVEA